MNTRDTMEVRLAALLGLLSLAAGLLAFAYQFPEQWWQDRRFRMSTQWQASHEAVLIGLDEHYAERYGKEDPSGAYLASIVRALTTAQPSVIALDFALAERADGPASGGDLGLAVREAASRGVSVVLPTRLARWRAETSVVRAFPDSLGAWVLGGHAGWRMPLQRSGGLPAPRLYPVAEGITSTCYSLSFAVTAVAAHRRYLLVLVASVFDTGSNVDVVATPFGPERGGLVHLYAIDTLLRRPVWFTDGEIWEVVLAVVMFGLLLWIWRRWTKLALLLALLANVLLVVAGFVLFPVTGYMSPIAAPLMGGLLGTVVGFVVFGRIETAAAPATPARRTPPVFPQPAHTHHPPLPLPFVSAPPQESGPHKSQEHGRGLLLALLLLLGVAMASRALERRPERAADD